MVQLVDAVRYMHEQMHITHGDIKLENIFIRSLKPMQVCHACAPCSVPLCH